MKYYEAIERLPPGIKSEAPVPISASIKITMIAEELAGRRGIPMEGITLTDAVRELRRHRENATIYEVTPSGKFRPQDPEEAALIERNECLLSLIRKYIPESMALSWNDDPNRKGIGPLMAFPSLVGYDNHQPGKEGGKDIPPAAEALLPYDPKKGPDAGAMALEYPFPEGNKVEEGSKGYKSMPLMK